MNIICRLKVHQTNSTTTTTTTIIAVVTVVDVVTFFFTFIYIHTYLYIYAKRETSLFVYIDSLSSSFHSFFLSLAPFFIISFYSFIYSLFAFKKFYFFAVFIRFIPFFLNLILSQCISLALLILILHFVFYLFILVE